MDRQWRRTEDAIWDAFGRLLVRKNYRHITINDLIEEADIGRSTFYSHYGTKDELLEQICVRVFAHLHPEEEPTHPFHVDTSQDDGRTSLLRAFYHIRAYQNILIPMMNQRNHSYLLPYLRREFRIILPQIQERFVWERTKVHADLVRDVPDNLKYQLLEDTLITIIHWWFKNGLDAPPETVLDYYCRIFNVLG